jgi:hypothetical protein
MYLFGLKILSITLSYVSCGGGWGWQERHPWDVRPGATKPYQEEAAAQAVKMKHVWMC